MKFLSSVFSWSFQSLGHRPLRAGLTILEIGLAMALVLNVLGFYRGYRAALARNIDGLGYQVLVTAKGCPYEAATLVLRGGVIPMYLDESVVEEIARDQDVASVTRFFLGTEPDGDKFRVYMGVDDHFLGLKPWISFQRGSWFQASGGREVILGYNVAEELRVGLGDVVPVRKRPFKVRGILDRNGTQDDGMIFLPLREAQKIFDKKGKVTGVGIQLKDLDRLDQFGARLYEIPSTQVITLKQVQRTILDLLQTARWLMSAVAIVALLIAVVGILNTVLMAVLERLPDLGVIRAIGGRGRDIFFLVWGEALLLTLAGVIGGVLVAFAAAGGCEILLRQILPYTPAGRLIRIALPEIWQAGSAILLLGLLGGLYPAIRAVAVSPMKSIRGSI